MWPLLISVVVTVMAGFVAYFVFTRKRELIVRFRRIVWRNVDHRSFSAALHPTLPLSTVKGWTLLGAANGKRQWLKTVPSLSETCAVFATHSIIETSPKDVIATLCDTLQQPDWDPFASKVNIVMTPTSHDGVQSDIVKVAQTGSENSCTVTRCWRFSDNGCCWLLSAHVSGCLGDVKWSYWKADPIETEGLDGFSVVTLFVGPSYSCLKPPSCLSSWLRSLQQHVTLKQCEMNCERLVPRQPVVIVASGKESNEEKGGTVSNTKVVKAARLLVPVTQAKSQVKHPVLDNERQSWVSLCDESAQTVQRVAFGSITHGWEYVDEQRGVMIMKKPAEPGDGRSLNRVKGTAKIKVPPFFILSYIGDFEKSKKWNEMFDHGEIIEHITSSTRITRLAYKSVFPATARDFCVVSGVRQLDSHTFINAASSVTHPLCREDKNFVRAESMAGGFAVIRDERDLEQCTVTYTTRVDLKGRVPTFVINKVSISQPMCVAVLRDLVEKEYKTLSNEEKRRWQTMTLKGYLRRGETGGVDEEIDVAVGEDTESYEMVQEEEERESEWIEASGQMTEWSFDGSVSETMSMEESIRMMPHDVDLPLTSESEVDYRTLGNQVCGDAMAEFLMASTVDLHSPKRQSSCGWMFQYVEKDVQVLKKSVPNHKFDGFMGKGIINLPPAVVWAAVKDPQTRFTYDNLLKTLDIVERIEPGLLIVYSVHVTANCFTKQARDLCYLHCERKDPSGKYIVAGRSIEHPKCPLKPNIVRAHAIASGWQVEPLQQDGRTVSLVSCLIQINLGGMVPARLMNLVSKRLPLSVAYLREYLTSS